MRRRRKREREREQKQTRGIQGLHTFVNNSETNSRTTIMLKIIINIRPYGRNNTWTIFNLVSERLTALNKIINYICFNSDSGKISVLVLLDLSAAFDTVDHNILLERLENWVGLSGMVLKWLRSYLEEGKSYYVSKVEHTSKWTSVTCSTCMSVYAPTKINNEKEPNCLSHLCR